MMDDRDNGFDDELDIDRSDEPETPKKEEQQTSILDASKDYASETKIFSQEETLQSPPRSSGDETRLTPAPDETRTLIPPDSSPESPVSDPGATQVPGVAATEQQPPSPDATTGQLSGTTILPKIKQSDMGPRVVPETEPRYDVQRVLGEGGAGQVELAKDKDIDRFVAVKKLKKDLHSEGMVRRFVEEIRTVGNLEHPNIVPIHDVGKDENGQYYFIMKYVQGETLQTVINRLRDGNREYHKKYTFRYRTDIFMEILKAVEFAHSRGVIHRDLKPANIMIGAHGEVMVMDWGIAKQIRRTGEKFPFPETYPVVRDETKIPLEQRLFRTEDNKTIGTPAYMSPEQARGERDRMDERTDIYSLCALFYEFLTLKSYLKPRGTIHEFIKGILQDKPRHAMLANNSHQPSVPADLSHFVAKGLEKDPGDRFKSVPEMINRLNLINDGRAPVQCPFTFTKRLTNAIIHMVNNNPMTGLMIFLMLLLIFGSGIYFVINLFLGNIPL